MIADVFMVWSVWPLLASEAAHFIEEEASLLRHDDRALPRLPEPAAADPRSEGSVRTETGRHQTALTTSTAYDHGTYGQSLDPEPTGYMPTGVPMWRNLLERCSSNSSTSNFCRSWTHESICSLRVAMTPS